MYGSEIEFNCIIKRFLNCAHKRNKLNFLFQIILILILIFIVLSKENKATFDIHFFHHHDDIIIIYARKHYIRSGKKKDMKRKEENKHSEK